MSYPYQRHNESDTEYRARWYRIVGAHLPAADAAICPCGSGLPVEDDGMCIVTACNRPVYRRSHCHIHYLIATGKRDPSLPIPPYVPRDTSSEDRFWANVDRSQQPGCWRWLRSTSPFGYGRVHWNGRSHNAHRVAWILTHGPVSDDMYVCHRCDNPICVNPDHLFLGTARDNYRDCMAKGRDHRGHPRGESHGHARLTIEQVYEIRDLYTTRSPRELGERFSISITHVHNIGRRRKWRTLPEREARTCWFDNQRATAPRTWHPYAMDIGYDPAFEAELDSRDDDNHCETCSDTGWTTDDGGATYSVCLHGWEDEG